MRALNKYTLIGLLLILLSFGARAEFVSGEFELEGDCFEAVFVNYDFKNNWTETVTYKLTAVGEGAEWVNINGQWIGWTPGSKPGDEERSGPLVFELKPGETKILYAYFKPRCWTKPGKYVIGLQYSSKKGVKTREIIFTVKESRKIELGVSPEKIELGQCEPGEFDIKATNKSKIGETIELSVDGLKKEWIELSSKQFFLEKGAHRTVKLKVSPKCNDALKEYEGKAIAKIKNTELKTTKKLYVELIDKQEIQLGAEKERAFSACNDLVEEKEISVTNKGRAKDVLALSLDGPEWIELKDKAFTLKAGETQKARIVFHSGEIEEKDYTFTLKAFSDLYEKETVQKFKVTIRDCYKLELKKVSGPVEQCLEEPLSYEFLVKNIKERDSNVKVSVKGMSAEVSPAEFSLAEGKEQKVALAFDLSDETAGKKSFTLIVNAVNFELSKKFTLQLNDCYAIKLNAGNLTKTIEVSAGTKVWPQEKIITSTAKNTGTKSQILKLSVLGVDWILLEPQELALNPGEEREFYTYFVPPMTAKEGEHKAVLQANAKDFQKKITIKANVEIIGPEEEIDISAESKIEEEIIEEKKTVKATINLRNIGNRKLIVKDISAEEFNVEFEDTSFPLDVNEETAITATVFLGELEAEEISFPITIQTDRGPIKKMLTVSLEKETAVVETPTPTETPALTPTVSPTVEAEKETKTITTKINFKNTEPEKLTVSSITAEDYNARFEPNAFEVDTNKEQEITATITVPKDTVGQIEVPITIKTSRGDINKTLTINIEAEEAPPAGFFGLGNKTANFVILLFLALVAIIIVFLAYRAYQKPLKKPSKKKEKPAEKKKPKEKKDGEEKESEGEK